MSSLVENIGRKRNVLAVAVMNYAKLRGRLPGVSIAVVEGEEDKIFLSGVFQRLTKNWNGAFFVANGKDNVLGLRNLAGISKELPSGGQVAYFVDRDFDGLKGFPSGDDLYVTPTYSIENILVCKQALRKLLMEDFKLTNPDSIDDVDVILATFDSLLVEYADHLKEANRVIHFVRQKSLAGEIYTCGSIDSSCRKFAELDSRSLKVQKLATGEDLLRLISVNRNITEAELAVFDEAFEKLNPSQDWRGKFIFYLFKRFVAILVEDRNSSYPQFFSKGGGKVSVDATSTSFIRSLASLCNLPECLENFVTKALNH